MIGHLGVYGRYPVTLLEKPVPQCDWSFRSVWYPVTLLEKPVPQCDSFRSVCHPVTYIDLNCKHLMNCSCLNSKFTLQLLCTILYTH